MRRDASMRLLGFLALCLVVGGASSSLQERLLLTPPIAQCDPSGQRAALLTLFYNTGGAAWTNRTGWPAAFSSPTDLTAYLASAPVQSGACNATGAPALASAGASGAAVSFPDHCCWHGVGCDSAGLLAALSLGANGVSYRDAAYR